MTAKKAAQPKLPGTFEPVPDAVTEKATEYVGTLYERMEMQEQENTLRGQLIELMVEHDVGECDLDDYSVSLTTSPETRKIKVKKVDVDGGGE